MKKHYTVVARFWRDIFGNAYHTSEVFCNSKWVGKSKSTYGAGVQHEITAMEVLKDNGHLKEHPSKHYLLQAIQKEGGTLLSLSFNVNRKKDL